MVDSCLSCKSCKRGEEQKCSKQIGTYAAKAKSGRAATFPAGGQTLGGYTSCMVVHEHLTNWQQQQRWKQQQPVMFKEQARAA